MRSKFILILLGILIALVGVYFLASLVTPGDVYKIPEPAQSNFKGPGDAPMRIEGPTGPPPSPR